jgi:hypothetical protein
MAKYAHGLELTVPNSVPVRPARRPSSEYTSAKPATYANVNTAVRPRDRPAAPAPPRMPAVIGIIG